MNLSEISFTFTVQYKSDKFLSKTISGRNFNLEVNCFAWPITYHMYAVL